MRLRSLDLPGRRGRGDRIRARYDRLLRRAWYVLAYVGRMRDFVSRFTVREDADDLSPRDELSGGFDATALLLMFAGGAVRAHLRLWCTAAGMAEPVGVLLANCLGCGSARGAECNWDFQFWGERRRAVKERRVPVFATSGLCGNIFGDAGMGRSCTALRYRVRDIYCRFDFLYRRMKAEDNVLLKQFGQEYEDYMRETDAMIPTIW